MPRSPTPPRRSGRTRRKRTFGEDFLDPTNFIFNNDGVRIFGVGTSSEDEFGQQNVKNEEISPISMGNQNPSPLAPRTPKDWNMMSVREFIKNSSLPKSKTSDVPNNPEEPGYLRTPVGIKRLPIRQIVMANQIAPPVVRIGPDGRPLKRIIVVNPTSIQGDRQVHVEQTVQEFFCVKKGSVPRIQVPRNLVPEIQRFIGPTISKGNMDLESMSSATDPLNLAFPKILVPKVLPKVPPKIGEFRGMRPSRILVKSEDIPPKKPHVIWNTPDFTNSLLPTFSFTPWIPKIEKPTVPSTSMTWKPPDGLLEELNPKIRGTMPRDLADPSVPSISTWTPPDDILKNRGFSPTSSIASDSFFELGNERFQDDLDHRLPYHSSLRPSPYNPLDVYLGPQEPMKDEREEYSKRYTMKTVKKFTQKQIRPFGKRPPLSDQPPICPGLSAVLLNETDAETYQNQEALEENAEEEERRREEEKREFEEKRQKDARAMQEDPTRMLEIMRSERFLKTQKPEDEMTTFQRILRQTDALGKLLAYNESLSTSNPGLLEDLQWINSMRKGRNRQTKPALPVMLKLSHKDTTVDVPTMIKCHLCQGVMELVWRRTKYRGIDGKYRTYRCKQKGCQTSRSLKKVFWTTIKENKKKNQKTGSEDDEEYEEEEEEDVDFGYQLIGDDYYGETGAGADDVDVDHLDLDLEHQNHLNHLNPFEVKMEPMPMEDVEPEHPKEREIKEEVKEEFDGVEEEEQLYMDFDFEHHHFEEK